MKSPKAVHPKTRAALAIMKRAEWKRKRERKARQQRLAQLPIIVSPAGNQKLGCGVASTSRLVGPTCPPDCPLLGNGCYAQRGRVAMAQNNLAKGRAGTTDDTIDALDRVSGVALVRHLVAGDWLKPTKDGRRVVDRDFCRSVIAWHQHPKQRYTLGWGYTHAPERMAAAGFGPADLPESLHIMASCHTIEHAEALRAEGWTTARVIERPEDRQKCETLCPYDLAKYNGETPPLNCSNCRLCLPGSAANVAFLKF